MEGSVLSFLKAEWKVSDTGSAHWASSFHLFQMKFVVINADNLFNAYCNRVTSLFVRNLTAVIPVINPFILQWKSGIIKEVVSFEEGN